MLKAEKRPVVKEEEKSLQKERLESFSNLLFEMVTKLGYVLPNVKYEDDPLRRKYQPALGFEKCLVDINQFLNSNIFNDNLDILDFLRCRIGEWKLLTNQLLPLLVFLVNQSSSGSEAIINLLLILNRILTDKENDENSQKSAYHKDLMHYMAIYKKLFSHSTVMSALTTLFASTIGGQSNMKIKCGVVAQILDLVDTLIVAPEPVAEKGNLNLNLAYGRKETVLVAMTRSKMINVIFGIASSFEDDDDEGLPFKESNGYEIPAKAWGIVAAIFRNVNVMDVIDPKISIKALSESEEKTSRKPIRHGRFSGSVSVLLSTGQTMLIKNSSLFTNGIPGSLDLVTRKNKKLEDQLSALQSQRKALLAEEKKMYLKLSKEFLESHFNALFLFIRKRWEDSPSMPPRDTVHYMEIAGYFLEFCRIQPQADSEAVDMYPLVFGIIHKPMIFNMIEFLHVTIIEKNYPTLLKLLRFYRELLVLIEIFSGSAKEDRKFISSMLQKELFHSKTMLMVIKRVVDNSKPVLKYFSNMILDCNHVLMRLVEAYGQEHPYWGVTTASHVFNQLASKDEDDQAIRVLGAESNFSYQSLIRHYSSRDMVDFYINLLGNCQFESTDTNNKVGQYLERVVKCPDFCKLLLRPTLVVQLQKVLSSSSSWANRNSDLVHAAKCIVRKYCEFIKSDPNNLKLTFFT